MPQQDSIRVLIAEDDFLLSTSIKRTLQNIGFEVVGTAGNGKQAVDMVIELEPDIVLMDIKMPDVDGIEATRIIQKQKPTPVVILSAHESNDLIQQATEAGVSAYLTKPPEQEEIERADRIPSTRRSRPARHVDADVAVDAALAEEDGMAGRPDSGAALEVEPRAEIDPSCRHAFCETEVGGCVA